MLAETSTHREFDGNKSYEKLKSYYNFSLLYNKII